MLNEAQHNRTGSHFENEPEKESTPKREFDTEKVNLYQSDMRRKKDELTCRRYKAQKLKGKRVQVYLKQTRATM